MAIDYTAGTCPNCGGRLCVDTQYPDYVFCDTCSYPEPEEQENLGKLPPPPAEIPLDGLELDVEEEDALSAWRGWRVVLGILMMICAFALATRIVVGLWELYLKWRV